MTCNCPDCLSVKFIDGKCFLDTILDAKDSEKGLHKVDVCLKCFAALIPVDAKYSSEAVLKNALYKNQLIVSKCKCGKTSSIGIRVNLSSKYIERLRVMHHDAIERRKIEAQKVVFEKVAILEKRLNETSREAWEKETSSIPYNLEHKFSKWEKSWKVNKELRDDEIRIQITRICDKTYIEYNAN